MEIVKIEREALILDTKEKEKLLQLIKYCRHRVSEHCGTGISGSAKLANFIDYMIKNLC